jgi:hypothetical protein
MRSLFTGLVVLGGPAISALLIPGQWAIIALLGAVLGFGVVYATSRGTADAPQPYVRPEHRPGKWGMFEVWFLIAFLLLGFCGACWMLFGTGDVYRLPVALASSMVNTVGMLLGLTVWLMVNARKLIEEPAA